jgi:hypothetical protein
MTTSRPPQWPPLTWPSLHYSMAIALRIGCESPRSRVDAARTFLQKAVWSDGLTDRIGRVSDGAAPTEER